MSGEAEIQILGSGGMFVADACRLEGAWLHAEGRWRTRTGANHAEVRWSELKSYSWPVGAVAEVRWQDAPA